MYIIKHSQRRGLHGAATTMGPRGRKGLHLLRGLGALQMGAGLDFACNDAGCVPSTAYQPLFQQVQSLINAAAAKLSIGTTVPTDGVISQQTAALFDQVAAQISPGLGLPNMLNIWLAGTSPQLIAQNADALAPELTRYVQGAQAFPALPTMANTLVPASLPAISIPVMPMTPTVAPPAVLAPPPVAVPPPSVATSVAASVSSAFAGIPRWVPWAAGAVGVLLLLRR